MGTLAVVVCCFLPIHSGHRVRWTYQPGSHRRKVTQDFSSTFFLRCVPLFFSREGFSNHSFPSSTVKSNFVLLLFLTFSALVAKPKKLLYTVANPACGLLNREKKEKKKSGSAPPRARARCSFGEKKKKKKKKISRDASTYLGATQVGVTQVVSVRRASVQGFLRLVS